MFFLKFSILPKRGLIAGVGRVDGGQVISIKVDLIELFVSGRRAALSLRAARRAPHYGERALFC